MVAWCGKPRPRRYTEKKDIREKEMPAEKYEAKSKSDLREVRRAAMIEYR
jgi:peptidyl-prolyl cis-trans isomerase SurA